MKKNSENERLLKDIKESPEGRYKRVRDGNPYYTRKVPDKKKIGNKKRCRGASIDGRE